MVVVLLVGGGTGRELEFEIVSSLLAAPVTCYPYYALGIALSFLHHVK